MLATSVKVEVGGVPERSMGYARKQLTCNMVQNWSELALSSRYIGHRYIRLCEGPGSVIQPSHLGGGHLLRAVGKSNCLTARMA